MLRIYFMQQWFNLSDPGMEDALYDVPCMRAFARLDLFDESMPDETTILRFRHLLEKHDLATDMLRVVNDILQAKGLLMKMKSCNEEEAYTLMRRQAMSRQQKLIQVAEQIIAMSELLG